MPITCIIRYSIDPFNKAAFEQYVHTWGLAIPKFLLREARIDV